MTEPRVGLLSDFARSFVEKGRIITCETEKGVWSEVLKSMSCSDMSRGRFISGIATELHLEQLLSEGFIPFCKIENRKVFIQKSDHECWVAITEDDIVWDLTEWGENYCFATRFMAEIYFMITRDDFFIDEEENLAFQALAGCIEITKRELTDARCLVYWTLLDHVIKDEVITEEEEKTMEMVREALQMENKDIVELHEKIIVDYCKITLEFNEGKKLDSEQISNIKAMTSKLGISPNIVI